MARIPTFTVTNPHADPVDDALTPGSFTTTGLPTPTAPNAPAWMREQAPPDLTPDTPPSEAAASGVREVSAPPQEEVEDDANGPTLAELFAQADETKDVTEPTVEDLFRQADKEKLAATVAETERAKVQKDFEEAAAGKPTVVNSTPELSMWNMFSDTAFGRVLELAGEGWQKGYKDDPMGLGPETLQKLRDVGFLPDGEHGSVDDFTQMFNQQVIVPMVAAADVATRLPAGLLFFTAGAVGQLAEETGVTKLTGTTKGRLVRDIVSLGEMAGLLSTLYMPAGVPAVERRLAERRRADTTEAFGGAPAGPREPIASGGPATPPPVIPQPYSPSTSHLRHRPSAYSPDVPGEELTAKNIEWLDYTNGLQDVARASGIPYRNRSRFDVIADLKQKYPHLDSSKGPYDFKGFADTRGKGDMFHGTSSPIPGGKPSEGHYRSLNYYGNGFYTTDAADVASGYSKARQAKDPTIYRVTENSQLRMYDMESPLTPEMRGKLGEVGDTEDLIEDALNSGAKNMREIFDEIRDNSAGANVSADEVQNLFDSIQEALKAAGYAGMTHKGGLRTKAPAHDVRIYFNPETDLTLTKVDPDSLRAAAAPGPQAPADLPAGSIVPHAPIDDVPPEGGAHKSWEDLKNERGKTGDSGSSGPSAAGATGPTDHAGNINLNYIDDDASIQEVIRAAAAANDDFRAARRGVVTHEDTVRAADALGMTPEELSKRLIGQALNAEEVHAVRQLGIDSAEAVHQAASKYRATGSTSDLIVLRENILRHTMIQEHWAGAAAEAGRALNIFKQKIYASAGQKQTGQTIEDHLRRINDPEVLEDLSGGTVGRDLMDDLAKAITNAKTPREVSRVTDRLRKAGVGDMFYEFWINGLLSGAQTQARNAISNTAFALSVVPETAAAGVVGSIRRLAGGSQDSVRLEEAYARLIPFFTSQKRALKLALNAWRTEVPSFGGTKLEYLDKFGGAKRGAIPDLTGKINLFGREINYTVGGKQVRIPGRLLMASDEYYKAIAYDQEISAIAWRTALKEKLKGSAFRDRVVDLQQNPTEDMVKKAMANADYQTFTTKYDKITGTFAKLRDLIPGAKLIVPFLRTPSNIMKRVYERTPLAFLTPGKAMRGKLGAAEQDMAIARATIGSLTSYVSYEAASAAYEEVAAALRGEKGEEAQATAINEIEVTMALATSVTMAVMEGRLNGGGPSKPQERAVMYADGWMPNSIRVGDMLYSYAGTEPMGMLMSLAASSAELRNEMTEAEADKLAGLIMGAFKNAVIEKTFFKGPANFLDMLMNPEMKGEKWAQSMAASMIPSVVGGLARQEDPTMREIGSMLDAIQSRVPFMSNRLPPKIDIWGKDIVYGGSLGPDILSPIYESKMKNDPVNIKLLSIRVWPAKLRDTMGGVELIGKEIEDWQRTAGALRYTMVAEQINSPGFNELELWMQKRLVKSTLGAAKALAKVTFLGDHKAVADRINLNKIAGLFDEDEASYVED
tara:strand:+ start:2115 stop:6560 length:4446 start_codon:yes stop_codon:yes gene_type:complete